MGFTVLRICSVFEPPPEVRLDVARRFDPIGGMQNHTAELTRGLDRAGVRQVVITTRPPSAPRRHRVGEAAEVNRLGWRIRRFRQLYSLPAVAHVVRAGRAADLVHVHLGEDLAVVPLGLLAARLYRIPMVMTVHCSLRHTFDGEGLRARVLTTLGAWLEGVGTRRAAAVIVITERLRSALAGRDVAPELVHLIPSGVNRALFRGPFDDPLPNVPRPRVMFVGRIAPQKGVFDLVRAIPHIARDASVVIVGDGPDRAAVEREAAALGVDTRLRITGFVVHDRVPAFLGHADVLVLPSHHEELGSILLEAMQSGVAIAAADAGGIPNVVSHEDNGLLFTPRDPRRLAGAVDRLLGDRELRERLVRSGRRRITRHDWSRLALEVLDVYRKVLSPTAVEEAAEAST